jgi:hypothetical protein
VDKKGNKKIKRQKNKKTKKNKKNKQHLNLLSLVSSGYTVERCPHASGKILVENHSLRMIVDSNEGNEGTIRRIGCLGEYQS